jgi:hypothetical protein
MGLQSYGVFYSTDGLSFTALTDVQNIQFSIGRQAQLEQIKSSTGSFQMRYPTGYASPITDLVAGTRIRIQNITPDKPYTVFSGRINNVTAEYGIPFSGGIGQADYLTVTFEGAFATLGRMQGNNYAMAAGTISAQALSAGSETGLDILRGGVQFDSQLLAATTISSTWADWLARVCQTTNSRISDSRSATSVTVVSPFDANVSTVNFSDVANDATNQVYNNINFDSLADNFYTQVTVTPESFTAATVTNVGAVAPFRTYQTNTLNASTAQANDFANYLLSNYGTAKFAISSFSCIAEAQSSFQLDKIGKFNDISAAPGTQVGVTFRGVTYQCIIEGVNVSATPAGALFTYYVSGADLNAYMILNSQTFGKLDENKLGF